MARYYKERSTAKTVVRVVLIALAALIIVASLLFFGFRKYIVYTDDGLKVEVPWLQESGADVPAAEE